MGHSSVALTDFATVSGAVNFVQNCKKNDIIPVLGCEIVLSKTEPETITLLCKNKNGWRQLLELVSICSDSNNYGRYPSITKKDFVEFMDGRAENFVCLDGYLGSAFCYSIIKDNQSANFARNYDEVGSTLFPLWKEKAISHISTFTKLFKDDYFLETQGYSFQLSQLISNCIKEITEEIKFTNTVVGHEIYYEKRSDARDHRLLLCSGMKTVLSKAPSVLPKEDWYHLSKFFRHSEYFIPPPQTKSIEKLESRFDEYNILSKPKIPHFDCGNQTQIEYLKDLCRDGWKNILKPSGKVESPEAIEIYRQRIVDEFKVIEEADLAGYFLIVNDYVDRFRSSGSLIGPGRGSAAGCLVSYLLGMTLIDPIEYGLLFSRFYNVARKGSLPDIDIDFIPHDRDNVIQYQKEKYGNDKVCQMVTFSRLQGRSALKEVLRINESCSFTEMNKITKYLPTEASISDKLEEMENPSVIRWTLENDPGDLKKDGFCWLDGDELKGDYASEFSQAMRIEGLFKNRSKHASGVVISSTPLNTICPMIKSKTGGELIAGVEMNDLEAMGGVKFDILGLYLLKKIHETCGMV